MADMVLLVFSSISISTVGADGARVSFLALRMVVVDISQFPELSELFWLSPRWVHACFRGLKS